MTENKRVAVNPDTRTIALDGVEYTFKASMYSAAVAMLSKAETETADRFEFAKSMVLTPDWLDSKAAKVIAEQAEGAAAQAVIEALGSDVKERLHNYFQSVAGKQSDIDGLTEKAKAERIALAQTADGAKVTELEAQIKALKAQLSNACNERDKAQSALDGSSASVTLKAIETRKFGLETSLQEYQANLLKELETVELPDGYTVALSQDGTSLVAVKAGKAKHTNGGNTTKSHGNRTGYTVHIAKNGTSWDFDGPCDVSQADEFKALFSATQVGNVGYDCMEGKLRKAHYTVSKVEKNDFQTALEIAEAVINPA